jgi:hypothetical protein
MYEPVALDYKVQTSLAFKTIFLCPSFVEYQVLNQSISGDNYRRVLTDEDEETVIKQNNNVVVSYGIGPCRHSFGGNFYLHFQGSRVRNMGGITGAEDRCDSMNW